MTGDRAQKYPNGFRPKQKRPLNSTNSNAIILNIFYPPPLREKEP